ncbi:MAG: chorismate synthase, partial [Pseudomonadota bacterium]
MSHNSFGHLFRFTTWGESHGPALGVVVDGCPPGLAVDEDVIARQMARRRPGQSKFTTQRQEADAVKLLSGVMAQEDGTTVTTGTPISMMIENTDQRSKDYSEIARRYRPGHADFTYDAKYGVRDFRGGGRSSARETAARVAAGAIARLVVPGVTIRAGMVQMGPHTVDRTRLDWTTVDDNPFFCPDPVAAQAWEEELAKVRKAGSSVGAVIEVVADG